MWRAVAKDAGNLYVPNEGEEPVAYLWARTVTCDTCGFEIPLMRSFYLADKSKRTVALRPIISKDQELELETFCPKAAKGAHARTIKGARATCVNCNSVLSPDRVRAQIKQQNGGGDVIFSKDGQRIGA